MAEQQPAYADFEDYRYMQRIVVVVRWFVIASWLAINHYRVTWDVTLLYVDLIGVGMVILNGWLHLRLRQDRPLSRRFAIGMSIADVVAITVGIAVTGRFDNIFFVLYYPALVGLALVVSSARFEHPGNTQPDDLVIVHKHHPDLSLHRHPRPVWRPVRSPPPLYLRRPH